MNAASFAPVKARPDPTSALIAAVRGRFSAGFHLEQVKTRAWASASFNGARHEMTFRVEGPGAEDEIEAFLDGLAPRSIRLDGHLLADIAVTASERRPGFARASLEVLTVDD